MVRAAVGLAIGFGAAAVTFVAVDRYGTHDGEESTVVVYDSLDYDGYCSETFDGARAMRIGDEATDWLCGRRLNGIWSPTPIDHSDLCRWQFGSGTEPRLRPEGSAFDWICIDPARA